MKLFEELRPKEITEDYNQDMPVLLVLKRKAIRIYPDGIKVGLYYSDRLKKFVSIPFGDDTKVTDITK